MDDTKATVLSILADLTGEDVSSNMDVNLFDEGILDSMGSVQLLLELQNQLGIEVPVSEFQRSEWDTPAKIVAKVENYFGSRIIFGRTAFTVLIWIKPYF